MLTTVATAFTHAHRTDLAVPLVVESVREARLSGRVAVFDVIGRCASTLAAVYDGTLLERLAGSLIEIESWWAQMSSEKSDPDVETPLRPKIGRLYSRFYSCLR